MRDLDRYKQEIERLLDMGNLTKWQYGFLNSVGDKLDRDLHLSEREWEILDSIIEEKG